MLKTLPEWVLEVFYEAADEPPVTHDVPMFDRTLRGRKILSQYNELDFTLLASYGEAPNESD